MDAKSGLSSVTAVNHLDSMAPLNSDINITSAKFEVRKVKSENHAMPTPDNDSALSGSLSHSSGAASPHTQPSPSGSPEPLLSGATGDTNTYHRSAHHHSAAGGSSSVSLGSSTNVQNVPSDSDGGGVLRNGNNAYSSCPTQPSRVVHFRGVSPDAQEIWGACLPFGEISRCLVLRNKNQALVEFKDKQSAIRLINTFNPSSRVECKIANRKCYVQYSNHAEIRLNEWNQNNDFMLTAAPRNAHRPVLATHSNIGGGGSYRPVHAALQQRYGSPLQAPGGINRDLRHHNLRPQQSNSVGSFFSDKINSDSSHATEFAASNCVLRVIIENAGQSINADQLYPIFSKYGRVLKIITFIKDRHSQGFIQFADRERAAVCKRQLDGASPVPNCLMRVGYSRMNNLQIKFNNERNRDYSHFVPIKSDYAGDMNGGGWHASAGGVRPIGSYGCHQQQSMGGLLSGIANTHYQQMAALVPMHPHFFNQILGATANSNGAAGPISPFFNIGTDAGLPPNSPAMHNLVHPWMLSNMIPQPQLFFGLTGASPIRAVAPQSVGVGSAEVAAPAGLTVNNSTVVYVNNLNETKVLPDSLFKLFGVYGDVQRVKIMFDKRDSALVQMSDASQARTAIRNLDNARLYGRPMKLTFSHKPEVKLPHEWQDSKQDAGLTCNYANSPLHRFKRQYSTNFRNVYPPSDTLHLSNIPSNKTADDIREAFKQAGFEAQEFRYFTSDRTVLMQFATAEVATEALIAMHNYDFQDGNYLRVSFARSRSM